MRYFFGKDEDGHDFLIPEEKTVEWEQWQNELSGDGDESKMPDGIEMIDNYKFYTFENLKSR
jgi:hypothetical protein